MVADGFAARSFEHLVEFVFAPEFDVHVVSLSDVPMISNTLGFVNMNLLRSSEFCGVR